MFPEELLAEIDQAANLKYMSRSEYVRYVMRKSIAKNRAENIDTPPLEIDFWKTLDANDS